MLGVSGAPPAPPLLDVDEELVAAPPTPPAPELELVLLEELLLELAARYTLLVVSHSLNQARRLARSMFVLREGGQIEAVDSQALGDKDRLLALMDELF